MANIQHRAQWGSMGLNGAQSGSMGLDGLNVAKSNSTCNMLLLRLGSTNAIAPVIDIFIQCSQNV